MFHVLCVFLGTARQGELRRLCFYIQTWRKRDTKDSLWGNSCCRRERREGMTLNKGLLQPGSLLGTLDALSHVKSTTNLILQMKKIETQHPSSCTQHGWGLNLNLPNCEAQALFSVCANLPCCSATSQRLFFFTSTKPLNLYCRLCL